MSIGGFTKQDLDKVNELCIDNEELRKIYIDFIIRKLANNFTGDQSSAMGFVGHGYDTSNFLMGDLVTIDSFGSLQFPSPVSGKFAVGMVVNPGQVAYSGEITGMLTGLSPGLRYWLSSTPSHGNTMTVTEPCYHGDYSQGVGFAKNYNTFILSIEPNPRRVISYCQTTTTDIKNHG
jgi:hypothetical protein|tara:strand:- start:339 stop:869 length:531 start_codon:yes stop_codon:yes gene_type:complete